MTPFERGQLFAQREAEQRAQERWQLVGGIVILALLFGSAFVLINSVSKLLQALCG